MTYIFFTILATILLVVVPLVMMVVFKNKTRQEMKTILGVYFLGAAFVFVALLTFANLI
jgi:hypothetical protein